MKFDSATTAPGINTQSRPWMTKCAMEWLLKNPFSVLICDALEAAEPQHKIGICMSLYKAQRCIVFAAYNLHLLPNECPNQHHSAQHRQAYPNPLPPIETENSSGMIGILFIRRFYSFAVKKGAE